ncbi:hypothetical protein P2A57_23495 [Xanthomonas perforans]
MNGLATVHHLPHDLAVDAHSVSAYQLDDGPQKGMTVVEVTDRHQQVIARTVTDATGSREEVAELVLARSPLQRCAGWAIEPFGRRKRVAALVSLRVSSHVAPFEALRSFGATA